MTLKIMANMAKNFFKYGHNMATFSMNFDPDFSFYCIFMRQFLQKFQIGKEILQNAFRKTSNKHDFLHYKEILKILKGKGLEKFVLCNKNFCECVIAKRNLAKMAQNWQKMARNKQNFSQKPNMATFHWFSCQLWLAMNRKNSWPGKFKYGHIGHVMATVGNTVCFSSLSCSQFHCFCFHVLEVATVKSYQHTKFVIELKIGYFCKYLTIFKLTSASDSGHCLQINSAMAVVSLSLSLELKKRWQ